MADFSDPSLLPKVNNEQLVKQVLKDTFTNGFLYPLDLFEILNQWGIPIEFINKPEQNFLAKITLTSCPKISINSIYNKNDISNIIEKDKTFWYRLRFSIAHELGHYFIKTHNDEQIRTKMLNSKIKLFASNYIKITEYQANDFAAELLMPLFEIKDLLDYSNNPIGQAEKISQKLEVSLTSSLFRLAKLSSSISTCLQINLSTGIIEKFIYSKSFGNIRNEYKPYKALFLNKGTVVPYLSASNKLLQNNLSSVKGIKNIFPVERWFPDYIGDDSLYEWPYIIGDKLITFIEIQEPIDLYL